MPEPSELCRMLQSVPAGYRTYTLRSRTGKLRRIDAPNPVLKQVQRLLLRRVLYRLEPHAAAHGFVPGRSIVSNAAPHVGRRWVIALDLRDFFPSTRQAAVRAVLQRLPERSEAEREAILRLVTRRGALPQGAPSSPHLANLAFRPLDEALDALARAQELTYTRYADDLAFSGDRLPRGLVPAVGRILAQAGYRLASHKTRFMGCHARQQVTGLIVNRRLALPRELRRWLRAVQHDAARRGLAAALERCGSASDAAIAGYVALAHMIGPARARAELAALSGMLSQTEVQGERRPKSLRPESRTAYGVRWTPYRRRAGGCRKEDPGGAPERVAGFGPSAGDAMS
jgi:hypothetical protein